MRSQRPWLALHSKQFLKIANRFRVCGGAAERLEVSFGLASRAGGKTREMGIACGNKKTRTWQQILKPTPTSWFPWVGGGWVVLRPCFAIRVQGSRVGHRIAVPKRFAATQKPRTWQPILRPTPPSWFPWVGVGLIFRGTWCAGRAPAIQGDQKTENRTEHFLTYCLQAPKFRNQGACRVPSGDLQGTFRCRCVGRLPGPVASPKLSKVRGVKKSDT